MAVIIDRKFCTYISHGEKSMNLNLKVDMTSNTHFLNIFLKSRVSLKSFVSDGYDYESPSYLSWGWNDQMTKSN